MHNEQTVALVTGANRGLGKRFAAQLVERGAKVYAAARRPETVDIPGVEAVQLDITAVHVGAIDTDMAAFAPADWKTDPAVVAELALDGLFAGVPEVLADDLTRAVKAQLSGS